MTDKEYSTQQSEDKRMDSIWWAGALIWTGLVVGADNYNLLPGIGLRGGWWLWIVLGLGVWALTWNGYRAVSAAPNPSTWDWIWTVIFLLVGLGGIANLAGEIVGAVVLVGIGIVTLFRALTSR